MKHTAVDWLVEELKKFHHPTEAMIMYAKKLERQQIIDAVDIGFEEGSKFPEDIKLNNAEQYYNETYNTNK